jgi:hypothetical protein
MRSAEAFFIPTLDQATMAGAPITAAATTSVIILAEAEITIDHM